LIFFNIRQKLDEAAEASGGDGCRSGHQVGGVDSQCRIQELRIKLLHLLEFLDIICSTCVHCGRLFIINGSRLPDSAIQLSWVCIWYPIHILNLKLRLKPHFTEICVKSSSIFFYCFQVPELFIWDVNMI
jgi:hypothetical protein